MDGPTADETQFDLSDPRLDKLTALIRDTFRVRQNHDPIYVDIENHLSRIQAPQHVVVFGRRGSGKSCLLIHHHQLARKSRTQASIYIQADEIKSLQYPDLLIRLLLDILVSTSEFFPWHRRLFGRSRRPIDVHVRRLRKLLDTADIQTVRTKSEIANDSRVATKIGAGGARIDAAAGGTTSDGREAEFKEYKRDYLERHLKDFKLDLENAFRATGKQHCTVIVDDFYLVHPKVQPDILDYLHRLFRGTDFYLKIGTVRHRTTLNRHDGRTIGVELYQDVEELDLDQTFEDVDRTKAYLARMLDALAAEVGLNGLSTKAFNPDGLLDLTLASGGVPRDYLTTFVEAVDFARGQHRTRWLTKTAIYKGADRVSYRTKLTSLRSDIGDDAKPVERVFSDLVSFCLKEKRKTAFLVSQDEVMTHPAEHDAIKQLMDFKLVDVFEADTSAASGRFGRFEAYTLDFSLFMEPRLRGIELVEFWKVDEQRRHRGIREAPNYPLRRASVAMAKSGPTTTEAVVEGIRVDIGLETSTSATA